jgi:membrane-bound ClpP family serine protease
MTDLNFPVYEVKHLDGRIEYVSGRDEAIFLRDHPEIAKEKEQRMTLKWHKEEFLTLTGTQAVKFKMATDLVPNLAAVYARLNVSQAQVIELAPTGQELLARKLAAIAPLLLGLAVLFLILEIKSPGFGLFISLSGICFAAFFAFQYWLHLASHVEVVILVLALVAIAVDLWFGLTGGILAACGAALFLMGTVLLFMPQDISFGDSSRLFRLLGGALVQSLVACSIIVIGIVILIAALPKLPWIKRVSAMVDLPTGDALKPTMQGEGLIGTIAVVESELRPAGSVHIGGQNRSAVSQHGEFLAVGTKVRVEGANFGDLVVRPLRSDETA